MRPKDTAALSEKLKHKLLMLDADVDIQTDRGNIICPKFYHSSNGRGIKIYIVGTYQNCPCFCNVIIMYFI